MKNIHILIIITVLVILYSLYRSCTFIKEDFLKDMLGLNKSSGITTKNNEKESNITPEVNDFLNKNKSGKTEKLEKPKKSEKNVKFEIIKEKIEELKSKIEENKKKRKQKRKKQIPEGFVPPSKLGGHSVCKFLPSSSCSTEYPVYMGASLGIPDNSGLRLTCNSDMAKPAKGLAIINKGTLEAVVLLDKGDGYTSIPRIKITGGGGQNASCVASIDKLGAINNIKVLDPGYNYTGTPKVDIDLPDTSSSCYLCCKKTF